MFELIAKHRENIHSGVAIICVKIKIKTQLWEPISLDCGTQVVWYLYKKIKCGTQGKFSFTKQYASDNEGKGLEYDKMVGG